MKQNDAQLIIWIKNRLSRGLHIDYVTGNDKRLASLLAEMEK